MPTLKKIVCAIDLSDIIDEVVDTARNLAKISGAEVVTLFAVPPLTSFANLITHNTDESIVESTQSQASELMTAFMDANFQGVFAKSLVVVGSPAEVILEQAKAEHADMIVMGTRGKKGFDRLLLGSVASKVIQSAQCPVLTVRTPEAE